ncbi:MAG TPA: mercury resistance system periplasmic binding protein MerP [Burkholderiales bacterium]|nr:mercury resistance system periplasmic binding protein MerP [Burkholderiales bacterium]
MKLLLLLAAALAAPALAAPRTVALDVPSMYCETCPITVKKALSRVPGVSDVKVSFEKKEAVVTFDDAKASVEALTRATANAGFPSKPRP